MPRTHRARRFVALLSAAALAVTLSACAPEASVTLDVPEQVDAAFPADTQAQMQAAVDRAVAASGSSGAVVGVWAPWSGSWVAGVGTVRPGGAATPLDASFKAGFVTRAMTCDVLYALAADKVVALDDQVKKYIPGMQHHGEITLSQLCDSTSGLASYAPALSPRIIATPERNWNPRELIASGAGRTKGNEPGAAFSDSDTGYVLLGFALEQATHSTAQQLLQKYVFTPTGMAASSLPTKNTSQLHGLWSPNDEAGNVACADPMDLTDISPSTGYTAAGVISDVTDLGRYVQALALGARPYDGDARFENPIAIAGDAPSWFTAKGGAYQAGSLIGQYGDASGYLTAAFADRTTGMTVVVVLNNTRASNVLVRALAWELASLASTAPAAAGQTAPEAGLPWTAEDMAAEVAALAVCPIP